MMSLRVTSLSDACHFQTCHTKKYTAKKMNCMKHTMRGMPIINSTNIDKISFCIEIQTSFCHKMTVSDLLTALCKELSLKQMGREVSQWIIKWAIYHIMQKVYRCIRQQETNLLLRTHLINTESNISYIFVPYIVNHKQARYNMVDNIPKTNVLYITRYTNGPDHVSSI